MFFHTGSWCLHPMKGLVPIVFRAMSTYPPLCMDRPYYWGPDLYVNYTWNIKQIKWAVLAVSTWLTKYAMFILLHLVCIAILGSPEQGPPCTGLWGHQASRLQCRLGIKICWQPVTLHVLSIVVSTPPHPPPHPRKMSFSTNQVQMRVLNTAEICSMALISWHIAAEDLHSEFSRERSETGTEIDFWWIATSRKMRN